MTAKLITARGEVLELTPEDGKITLGMGQAYVGGPVKIINLYEGHFTPADFKDGAQMLVNEEGLMVTMRENMVASGLANQQIVGDVLVLTGEHKWD